MTDFNPTPAQPVLLWGTPYERGLQQAPATGLNAEAIRPAVLARVEQAEADGLIDSTARDFLAAQRVFLERCDPDTMAELSGIAAGFSLPEEVLFAHQHLTLLRDLKRLAEPEGDGCSTWAVADGEDGPLVVKNRDFSGAHRGAQRVFLHEGPDITTGRMLCVGSVGSPGAYSSGINAAGLALADNHVGSKRHGIGWLRYFAMTRILATCRTVAEALTFIAARPHAGGGNLILGDRGGDVAAVEFGTAELGLSRAKIVWRTNHFITQTMAGFNLCATGDRIDANSQARFDYLGATLPKRRWSVAAAAGLMATHAGPGGAPLCQHPDESGSETISSTVFRLRDATLFYCEGNPCSGRWQSFEMTV